MSYTLSEFDEAKQVSLHLCIHSFRSVDTRTHAHTYINRDGSNVIHPSEFDEAKRSQVSVTLVHPFISIGRHTLTHIHAHTSKEIAAKEILAFCVLIGFLCEQLPLFCVCKQVSFVC